MLRNGKKLKKELTIEVVTGIGWLTGSKPTRIRFAL